MLRLVNLIGSVVFIAYGVMLPALSTIVFNGVAVIINLYYLFRLKKHYKE